LYENINNKIKIKKKKNTSHLTLYRKRALTPVQSGVDNTLKGTES
jgi:hypothetical protein